MTKQKQSLPLLLIAAITLTIVVIGLVIFAATAYTSQQYADKHAGCRPGQSNHKVTIENDKVVPFNTVASRCETLTITNLDDDKRLIAFGQHDKHIHYDGIEEKFLNKGQSLSVTLVQTGEFLFHDHENDDVQGTFTVK